MLNMNDIRIYSILKKYLIIEIVLLCCLQSMFAGPLKGNDWIEKDYTYAIHSPWNLDQSERYSYNPSTREHRFWIFKDDEPHAETSTTSPRSEMRIKNEYTSGNHQFEADYYILEGSYRTSIMQVWLGFQLMVREENGGTLYCWKNPEQPLMTGVYGKWIHMNIIHMMDEGDTETGGRVYVYLDGNLATVVDADITSDIIYFKCGVYVTNKKSEVKIRNIKIYEQKPILSHNMNLRSPKINFTNGEINVDVAEDIKMDIHDLAGKRLLSTSEKKILLKQRGVFLVKVSANSFEINKKIVN